MSTTPTDRMEHARELYDQAYSMACAALEAEALIVMQTHPRIRTWCSAMGSCSFHTNKEPIYTEDFRRRLRIPGDAPDSVYEATEVFNRGPLTAFNDIFNSCVPTVKLQKQHGGRIVRITDW